MAAPNGVSGPNVCGNPGEDRIYRPTLLQRQESGSQRSVGPQLRASPGENHP